MPIETATYISDLNANNPDGGDQKSTLDNHIRLVKAAVKATFPSVAGAVTPTHAELNYVAGVTSALQTQLNAKAPLESPAFTGIPTAPTAAPGTNNTQLATTAFVASQAFTSSLPNQTGNGGKFVTTDGSNASWAAITKTTVGLANVDNTADLAKPISTATQTALDGKEPAFAILPVTKGGTGVGTITGLVKGNGTAAFTQAVAGTDYQAPLVSGTNIKTINGASVLGAGDLTVGGSASITRSARTANTILGAADKGKLIDVTSGTFTQTFEAAATLGDGWWCYFRNSGTGTITLDPNGAETVDGAATLTLGPGAMVTIQCTGTAFYSVQSERAASGSSLTLLSTLEPTAAANVDALSTFTAGYDNYLIIGQGIRAAAADLLCLRVANAGVVDAGSNYWVNGAEGVNGSQSIQSALCNCDAVGKGGAFVVQIAGVSSATLGKGIFGKGVGQTGTTYPGRGLSDLYVGGAVSGVRFFMQGGNNFVAGGSIRIYGYNNT